ESIEGSATPRQLSARMKSRFGRLCRCARSSGAVVVASNVRRVIVRLRAAAAIIAQPVVKDWGRDGKRRRQRNSDANRGKIIWTVGLSSAGTIISRDPRPELYPSRLAFIDPAARGSGAVYGRDSSPPAFAPWN